MVPEPVQPVPPYLHDAHSICVLLEEQTKLLARLVIQVEAQALRPDVDVDIFVSTQPTVLSRNNRRQTRLWTPSAQSVLIDNLHGGPAPFMLQAGWNYLDVVEGARILVPSGAGFAALWQCLDTVNSGASL